MSTNTQASNKKGAQLAKKQATATPEAVLFKRFFLMIRYANPETTKKMPDPYETIWCDVVENYGMYAGHEHLGFE